MTFQHIKGFIPWNKVDTWLRGFRSIWIATTRPNGRPHSVPVWCIWDDEHIYFASNGKSQKDRNLAHQSAIVVHAGDGDDTIILEGMVAVVTDLEERSNINTAYGEKYVDPHSGTKATIPNGDILYRVTVERIMCWEYGVVGTRTDWQHRV